MTDAYHCAFVGVLRRWQRHPGLNLLRLSCVCMSGQLDVSKLHFGFSLDAPIFDGLTIHIPAGQFIAIVGPSGCGKSTLLRIIADLEKPAAGSVTFDGAKTPPRLGYVFQEPRLLPWRTVAENVALPLELQGSTGDRRELAAAALNRVGLAAEHWRKLPSELSGGMRMRVSLARALVTQPDVLLLDEPFAALDELSRQQLGEDLLRLWQDASLTTVFVTHQVAEAVFLSQRVIVLGGQPANVVADIAVPFAHPRGQSLREQTEFAAVLGEVGKVLRG